MPVQTGFPANVHYICYKEKDTFTDEIIPVQI
jgi:hypothetical protein